MAAVGAGLSPRCAAIVAFVQFLAMDCVGGFGDICRDGGKNDSCAIDGTGCEGERVELEPFRMNVSKWDVDSESTHQFGHIMSYAIKGQKQTWEMYLHGPHIHAREAKTSEDIPPIYVFATFTNQVYRFENISRPQSNGKVEPLHATQKVVGHALAPSTGYVFDYEQENKRVKGMFIAEGQPFWFSNIDSNPPHEVHKGGVQYMTDRKSCKDIFPTDPFHNMTGQVVNTVDCHRGNGICFFTVWKFYDDQFPVWNKFSELVANDCLYYCVLERDANSGEPKCQKTGIVVDEHGDKVCHKDGVGAVHGMTVGNTDAKDPSRFDILLVFTGKAEMDNGESSMKKLTVQSFGTGPQRDLRVLQSQKFGTDLFEKYAPKGMDVGGDHAWVDETGKYVWVSCFRVYGVGVHMLEYETGRLLYSVTGLDKYVPNQYTYTAGIHGVGTIGKKGSLLVVATSSCRFLHMCIPTIPWHRPVPEWMWSTAPLFVIDLASLTPHAELEAVAAPVLI